MRRLRQILLFVTGVSIPFNNLAFSLAGRSWSLGFVSALLYFMSMLPELPGMMGLSRRYGRHIWNVLLFALLLTLANFLNAGHYNTPVIPVSQLMCCLLFMVLLLHDRYDLEVLNCCVNGIGAGCLLMSVLYLSGTGAGTSDDGRLVMFGENANELGIYMSLGISVIFCSWIMNDDLRMKGYRFIWVPACILVAVLLFATGSRVAFVSFLLSIVISLCAFMSGNVNQKLIVASFLTAAVAGLYFLADSRDLMMFERLQDAAQERNFSGRDEILSDLWPYVADHLLYGAGQTGYVDISQRALGKVSVIGGTVYGFSPHNVLVEVVLYTGLWGLALWGLFWWKCFRSACRTYRHDADVLPLLLLIPVAGCVLSGQILTAKWAYVVYAYVITSKSMKCQKI